MNGRVVQSRRVQLWVSLVPVNDKRGGREIMPRLENVKRKGKAKGVTVQMIVTVSNKKKFLNHSFDTSTEIPKFLS